MEIEAEDINDFELMDQEAGSDPAEEAERPFDVQDEAEEAPSIENKKKTVVKRIVKNPQPKLDIVRLTGPRGINVLRSNCKRLRFQGKGYEREDLRLVLRTLEHWAHRLFPKLPFDDTLKQIEKLGTKKAMQNIMQKINLDMYQEDEIDFERPNNEDKPEDVEPFDELVGQKDPFDIMMSSSAPPQNSFNSSAESTPKGLTAEQKEQIEKNRLLALEKRRLKLATSVESKKLVNGSDSTFSNSALGEVTLVSDGAVSSSPSHCIASMSSSSVLATQQNVPINSTDEGFSQVTSSELINEQSPIRGNQENAFLEFTNGDANTNANSGTHSSTGLSIGVTKQPTMPHQSSERCFGIGEDRFAADADLAASEARVWDADLVYEGGKGTSNNQNNVSEENENVDDHLLGEDEILNSLCD